MSQANTDVLQLATTLSTRLAGDVFPREQAILYSQHTRIEAGQPPLSIWTPRDAAERVDDAVCLVHAALNLRTASDATWTRPMLRAAEILEWLNNAGSAPSEVPTNLLAAATYQLAGFPARAAGLLDKVDVDSGTGRLLRALLKADFPELSRVLSNYWKLSPREGLDFDRIAWASDDQSAIQLRLLIEAELSSALGIVMSQLRWGDDSRRLTKALDKLSNVAGFMLYSYDRYSWLLATLTAEVARTFVDSSLRKSIAWLPHQVDSIGADAVDRYIRLAYRTNRTQAWPSQRRGIARLERRDSFALCTPTGSGKTAVAELAIFQGLFDKDRAESASILAPLAMYLVPKRSLAAEVDARLQRVLASTPGSGITVTGLYGGIDWGPTDAWLTSSDKTVLICTYEKAEALVRFLGPLFLARLSLVVLDEAHMVQYDGDERALRTADSRPLRLESLMARLFHYLPTSGGRVIALSAVAANIEGSVAQWTTGDVDALPERNTYRSTRQLIGRLQCLRGRACEIRYDLLDRSRLKVEGLSADQAPFIPRPFPPHPPAPSFEDKGSEKRLRPQLFWAACHLVAPQGSATRHAVLISIPQQIGGYAQDLISLLEHDWAEAQLPSIFVLPTDAQKLDKYNRCLQSCEDYFGAASREYRLLQRGVVVHHGKMPGLMARLLVQLVEDRIVHLILATSTLSEGVNLPFETVLLPTLRRAGKMMEPREFANLVGRAGRPGFGTEGRCLVLLSDENSPGWRQIRSAYSDIVDRLTVRTDAEPATSRGRSALAALLTSLRDQWTAVTGSVNDAEFTAWLEQASPVGDPPDGSQDAEQLLDTLDSLDSVLLSAVVELEMLQVGPDDPITREKDLKAIWQRSYARYVADMESDLEDRFVRRGLALVEHIYPERSVRAQLYRTGLPPRQGNALTQLFPLIRDHLKTGGEYGRWTDADQYDFIAGTVELLARHPRFAVDGELSGGATWRIIAHWWLDPINSDRQPTSAQVSEWYSYISKNLGFRFAWGVGYILAIASNEAQEANGQGLQPTTLDAWPQIGLPWIAFWIKELVVWGTLDPVVAYLMAHGAATTRVYAHELAIDYYRTHGHLDSDDLLNPKHIRKWSDTTHPARKAVPARLVSELIETELSRDFTGEARRVWRVLPIAQSGRLRWVDVAGYELATSLASPEWEDKWVNDYDFQLDVDSSQVTSSRYL